MAWYKNPGWQLFFLSNWVILFLFHYLPASNIVIEKSASPLLSVFFSLSCFFILSLFIVFCKFTVPLVYLSCLIFVFESEISCLSKYLRNFQPFIPSNFGFLLFSYIFPFGNPRFYILDFLILSFMFLKLFHISHLFSSICCTLGNFLPTPASTFFLHLLFNPSTDFYISLNCILNSLE